MHKEIFTLVGIAASGKSTYATKILLDRYHNPFNLAKHQEEVLILNADSIREELYGDASIQGNPEEVFGILKKRLVHALMDDETKLIIIDNTSLTFKLRKRYYNLTKMICPVNQHTFEYNLVFFKPNLQRSLEWNQKRDRHVPDDVIEAQFNRYMGPTQREIDASDIKIVEVE